MNALHILRNDSNVDPLVRDALDIWWAGVEAVKPLNLLRQKLRQEGTSLVVDDQFEIDLSKTQRLIVVGAGKAAAAMALAFYQQFARDWPKSGFPELVGWINAPEGTFDQQIPGIHLHAARPTGTNMPTQACVDGTNEILELVSSAGPNDGVLCLISGGGSALLVAPNDGVSLAEKQSVAKHLAAAGGNIWQLNTVRRALSRVKGGGLARHCTAGYLVSLIISDVLGDPLETIASGPTVIESNVDPIGYCDQALAVMRDLGLLGHSELRSVVAWLQKPDLPRLDSQHSLQPTNFILGNNADSVDAAGVRAVELGYRYFMRSARQPEGDVEQVACQATDAIRHLRDYPEIDCWISGGEPTVRLPIHSTGKGGRNQQLSLCVLENLLGEGWPENWKGKFVFLSGGTDGEDGPTDAAGAYIDTNTTGQIKALNCDPTYYRKTADAYHFFSKVGGMIKTGPTGTNVCDLRIALKA